jgi:hypothetical protein
MWGLMAHHEGGTKNEDHNFSSHIYIYYIAKLSPSSSSAQLSSALLSLSYHHHHHPPSQPASHPPGIVSNMSLNVNKAFK